MLIVQGLSALTAVALGAGVVMALPGFSPVADASTSLPAVKGDRLDFRPVGAACSQQAWPYYETGCLRSKRPGGAAALRIVTTDRVTVQ